MKACQKSFPISFYFYYNGKSTYYQLNWEDKNTHKTEMHIQGKEGVSGIYCIKVGRIQRYLYLFLFGNKTGLLHFEQLLYVIKKMWAHQSLTAAKMPCQNDLVRMSCCMSDCSGSKTFPVSPSKYHHAPDKSKNCLTYTTVVFSMPAHHFPCNSLCDL